MAPAARFASRASRRTRPPSPTTGRWSAATAGAPLEVVGLRPAKDGLIARFAGVSDRNAADALKGVELSVPRHRLPEPDPGEFYFADLVGLAAVRPDGAGLGKVIAVHNFGAGDIIEVELAGSLETILVPFTREAVPEIDVPARRLVIDPPEGLLDE
jgi:16S rRNA processing protein RimM